MAEQPLRTPLGRAVGLGSAKEGVEHWWAQRVSAVALIALGLWFAAALIAHTGADRAVVAAWLKRPVTAILTILTLAATFYHAALGLQAVIEDWVGSEWARIAAITLVRFLCLALAVTGIFAVLRIAFGG